MEALSAKSSATVAAGNSPAGVAVQPDQGPVAAFSVMAGAAGSATRFDGSSSSDSDGSVVRYDWDFGDGTSAPDAGPTPSHTFAARGSYTATLTVTDDAGCSTSQVFTGQTAYCNGTAAAHSSRSVAISAAGTVTPPTGARRLGGNVFGGGGNGGGAGLCGGGGGGTGAGGGGAGGGGCFEVPAVQSIRAGRLVAFARGLSGPRRRARRD